MPTFSSSPFAFGVDREAHQRLGKPDLGQLDRVLRVEQQVARHRLLQLRDGADVAGPEPVGVNVILALELEQRAHALLAVAARVDERRVARDGAVEHAEDVDPPGERIGDRLEHEGGRLRPVDLDRRALLRGRGDALDEQVEQRRRPEVLRRDAARHREQLAARERVLERVRDLLDAELLALEVALHQPFVRLDDGVEELRAVLLHLRPQLGRNLARAFLLRALGARVRAHVQEVDDAGQLVLAADRQVHGDAVLRELRAQRLEDAEEVGALAVEHVHEHDAREAEVGRALPEPRRADLDAHHAAGDEERALDDAQRGDRVALEAGVAGRVDEVDLARPATPRGRATPGATSDACARRRPKSATVEPAWTLPSRLTAPAWNSIASTREVFPVPR